MSDEEFESHKKSLITERLAKLVNLNEEKDRLWWHIGNGLDFELGKLNLHAVCTMTN